LESQVREHVEDERIAWVARDLLTLYVYHARLIVSRDEHHWLVITEETQHQCWLEQLRHMAEEEPAQENCIFSTFI